MSDLIKKLKYYNIKFKVCNEKNQQINLYCNDKVVISYYGTTGTIYSKYVDLKNYKGEEDLIHLYNMIFNNKFMWKLINKINEVNNFDEKKHREEIDTLNHILTDCYSCILNEYLNSNFLHRKKLKKILIHFSNYLDTPFSDLDKEDD